MGVETAEITENDIREALKECYDPEIPINIVDLGLIYGIEIEEGNVSITMTLTTMGCPVADSIERDVIRKILDLEGAEHVEVEFVYDPPWNPDMVSDEGRKQLATMGIM